MPDRLVGISAFDTTARRNPFYWIMLQHCGIWNGYVVDTAGGIRKCLPKKKKTPLSVRQAVFIQAVLDIDIITLYDNT